MVSLTSGMWDYPKTWQLMVLSSGEFGIGSYMKQANITLKGGQEVRLPDIPAVPSGAKYGCFETIHGADDGEQFVTGLEAAVKAHHGTALAAFLARLVIDAADPKFAGSLAKQVHLVAAKLAEGMIDSAIGRVAKRFALVQVVMSLAHKYDLLPFPVEDIGWGISNCFKDLLTARGGDGLIEVRQAIERIEPNIYWLPMSLAIGFMTSSMVIPRLSVICWLTGMLG
jgi:putative DNA primase/helicase